MARINKLTKAQEAALPIVRDEWIRHGLSCEPADREAAQRAIVEAYRAAKLPAPTITIWLRSPLEGCIGAAMLHGLGSQVLSQVWSQVYQAGYGQHDAGWLGWLEFFGRQCGLEFVREADGLIALGKSCGWWWPFKGAVILTERHGELHRDDRGRLHSETGHALRYPDNWGVFAIHGVRVPERVVRSPESLTIAEIKGEQNAEVRRIMRERYGDGRYLTETGAKVIDMDSVAVDRLAPRSKSIHRALMVDDEENRWLVASDGSTRRCYHLRVPKDVATCRDAHNALSGMDESRLIMEA